MMVDKHTRWSASRSVHDGKQTNIQDGLQVDMSMMVNRQTYVTRWSASRSVHDMLQDGLQADLSMMVNKHTRWSASGSVHDGKQTNICYKMVCKWICP